MKKMIIKPKSKARILTINLFILVLAYLGCVFINIWIGHLNNQVVLDYEANTTNNLYFSKYKVTNYSASLLIEKYAYTLYSKYLQDYWNNVQILEKFNWGESDFSEVEEPLERFQSLENEIRVEEIRALKLIFSAYHVPNEVINTKIANYSLSEFENKMLDENKLKLGMDLLLGVDRQKKLNQLSDLLDQINDKLRELEHKKIEMFNHILSILKFTLYTIYVIILLINIFCLGIINRKGANF